MNDEIEKYQQSIDFQQQVFEGRFGRKMPYQTAAKLRNYDNFTTKIDRFVIDTEAKLLKVVQMSLESLTTEANRDKFEGGRLPIDTGFLKSSAEAEINEIQIDLTRGDKKQVYTFDKTRVLNTIARLKIGDTFYFGWTAEYAEAMEARNGFLESALMRWQSYVDAAVARVRDR